MVGEFELGRDSNAVPARDTTILLSGGVDSTVVAAVMVEQGDRPHALFVDYGQPALAAESVASAAVADHYGLESSSVTVEGLLVPVEGEIPGRNDLLIALARATRPGTDIAIGVHAGTNYPDCSAAHRRAWQEVLDIQTEGRTRLVAPLRDLSKPDALAMATAMSVPLELTYSCETGSVACGRCSSCLDRRNAEFTP